VSELKFENEDKKDSILICLAATVVCAVVLAIWGHKKLIGVYEDKSHNSEHYVDSAEYRSLSLELLDFCGVGKNNTDNDKKRCKEVRETISAFVSLSDLRAQQTMATATRGMLYGAWFQYLASLLALALVSVTLFATWRMLQQATNTTNYARQTLDAANDATSAAIKTADAAEDAERARVFIECKAKFVGDAKREFIVRPSIINYGATPARNIWFRLYFDSRSQGLPNMEDGLPMEHRQFEIDNAIWFRTASGVNLGNRRRKLKEFPAIETTQTIESFERVKKEEIEIENLMDNFPLLPHVTVYCDYGYSSVFGKTYICSSQINVRFTSVDPSEFYFVEDRLSLLSNTIVCSESNYREEDYRSPQLPSVTNQLIKQRAKKRSA
jgi:hypothetical protein